MKSEDELIDIAIEIDRLIVSKNVSVVEAMVVLSMATKRVESRLPKRALE